MQFFKKFRRSRINEVNIEEVRRRVHGIRSAGGMPTSLVDLFALIGEGDTIRSNRTAAADPAPQPERVLPSQVPTSHRIVWE